MLTNDAANRVLRQQSAFGEGKHVFGKEDSDPMIPIPRDKDGKPKDAKEGEK